MNRKQIGLIAVLTLFLDLAAIEPSNAALGDQISSVQMRSLRMRRTESVENAASFTVRESEKNGRIIREFIRSDGKVFAVTWRGYAPPEDLDWLGGYRNHYRDLARSQPRRHGFRRRQLQSQTLKVLQWGNMRNLKGKAYDPTLVPVSINIEELI